MSFKKVLITTGDVDGIGFEITLKALTSLGPQKNTQFYFFSNPKSEKKYLKLIDRKFKRFVFKNLFEALEAPCNHKYIYEILTDLNPARCFEEAALAATQERVNALVTAPLSKTLIASAGMNDRGHTDILRRLSPNKDSIFMAFKGSLFSLVLCNDHIPLNKVSESLTLEHVKSAILAAYSFLKQLRLPKKKQKIGLLGLNPHAGEISGLGDEEVKVLLPALEWAKKEKIPVFGPLIPDVCFQDGEYNKYGVFISLYHDQGLIPFKIYHKKKHGVQISLNLPFVRVSVDHGTAKDIFGKNKADPSSMKSAIQTALDLIRY